MFSKSQQAFGFNNAYQSLTIRVNSDMKDRRKREANVYHSFTNSKISNKYILLIVYHTPILISSTEFNS